MCVCPPARKYHSIDSQKFTWRCDTYDMVVITVFTTLQLLSQGNVGTND